MDSSLCRYVHNNIFFSFAVDGDFTFMQQAREQELLQQAGGATEDNSATAASEGPDKPESDSPVETTEVPEEPTDGAEPMKIDSPLEESPEPTTSDGGAESTSDAIKEEAKDSSASTASPVVESEQATYASSNNDLKGTRAYNNADVKGLYTLAMGIIDYRGHRVVAQVSFSSRMVIFMCFGFILVHVIGRIV